MRFFIWVQTQRIHMNSFGAKPDAVTLRFVLTSLAIRCLAEGGPSTTKTQALFGTRIQEMCFSMLSSSPMKSGHADYGGHVDLSLTRDVDWARSADPAATGAWRVVDYSRKARQEVQMDLFARELLFPRALARRWHLGEGLSASQIADRLQAPYDMVAVQLFDAIFLPPVLVPESKPLQAKALNPEQADAAKHLSGPLLLRAGPGTGKPKPWWGGSNS